MITEAELKEILGDKRKFKIAAGTSKTMYVQWWSKPQNARKWVSSALDEVKSDLYSTRIMSKYAGEKRSFKELYALIKVLCKNHPLVYIEVSGEKIYLK